MSESYVPSDSRAQDTPSCSEVAQYMSTKAQINSHSASKYKKDGGLSHSASKVQMQETIMTKKAVQKMMGTKIHAATLSFYEATLTAHVQ